MNVTETLYPTCRVLPLHHIIPTPVPCPSSLASPAAAIACIRGHACKDKSFSFPFFVSFLTNVTETLFTLGPKTPASPPHNAYPRASPLRPCKSRRRHCPHSQARK